MNSVVGTLLKDPPFWAALTIFIAAVSTFVWSATALRRTTGAASPAAPTPTPKTPWTFPPPERPPQLTPDVDATVKLAAPPPIKGAVGASSPQKGEQALVLSMMEDKFADLAKRIASLEQHPKATPGAPPAFLDPLLKRVTDMEAELKNLKFAFTQLAAAQNAINVNEITAKIHGMQKVLENLTGGTDIAKPS